jgi:hypothetical protein
MNDKPKFEVIDRRKIKAEEEQENQQASAPEAPEQQAPPAPGEPKPGPRLVVNEPKSEAAEAEGELPPVPTAKESEAQKAAYDASAQRLEDLVRAQNPAAGAPPPVTFENLVQQFYVSALIQMGAGAPEGQQPRVDIMGARATIDMLALLEEKTRGNLSEVEENTMQTALFEARMAFLELTNMISLHAVPPVPPQDKQ